MSALLTSSPQLIPWNHFGRKNVGFLYAIAHGAHVIYDTDDDNIPLAALLPLASSMNSLQTKHNTVASTPCGVPPCTSL